jgi:3-phytase
MKIFISAVIIVFILSGCGSAGNPVPASLETEPLYAGDGPDDSAIWIHPEDPGLSLIISANKGLGNNRKNDSKYDSAGLYLYDMNGRQIQYIECGCPNNVDLRYNFNLNGEYIDIAATGNRTNNTLLIFRINSKTGFLTEITSGKITVNSEEEIYGLCMYHSIISGKYYVFITTKDSGHIFQYELCPTKNDLISAVLVRSFTVGSQSEGCVADDGLGFLYVGEENRGIWKYNAEPFSDNEPVLVDTCDSSGNLKKDIEGLTIYCADSDTGYLIASSQGKDIFSVYKRENQNDYIGAFTICEETLDEVTGTDGIDVTDEYINSSFPSGFFIAQDDKNDDIKGTQNFKLVPWENIAMSFIPPLKISTVK